MTEGFLRPGKLNPYVNIGRGHGDCFVRVIETLLLAAKPQRTIAERIIRNGRFWLEFSDPLKMRYRRGEMPLSALNQRQTKICECQFRLNTGGSAKCRGSFAKLAK